MSARIRPGSHFIDVGASTGAISLPLAVRFGAGIRITAFEPAAAARGLLKAAIKRNRLSSIGILPYACSAAAGRETFHVLPRDDSGVTPFLPEASTLAPTQDLRAQPMQVKVTTLHTQFTGLFSRRAGPTVVKIDVEGLEAKVLTGARRFLSQVRPALAIDIHSNPFGDGTTERDVRAILGPLGYRFDHLPLVNALVCEPPADFGR